MQRAKAGWGGLGRAGSRCCRPLRQGPLRPRRSSAAPPASPPHRPLCGGKPLPGLVLPLAVRLQMPAQVWWQVGRGRHEPRGKHSMGRVCCRPRARCREQPPLYIESTEESVAASCMPRRTRSAGAGAGAAFAHHLMFCTCSPSSGNSGCSASSTAFGRALCTPPCRATSASNASSSLRQAGPAGRTLLARQPHADALRACCRLLILPSTCSRSNRAAIVWQLSLHPSKSCRRDDRGGPPPPRRGFVLRLARSLASVPFASNAGVSLWSQS